MSGEVLNFEIEERENEIKEIQISPDSLAAPQIPIDGVRAEMQDLICTISDTYQCSRDIVVSTLFAVIGAAIGKKIIIRDGKFENFMNLWICHVARSGSNKTAPTQLVLNPLILADRKAYKEYRLMHDDWKQRGGEDGGGDEPTFRQHLISDSTPEARNKVLSENENGVLLYRDEIKGFLDDMGRYNKSGEVSQLLSIFDGSDITVNRKSQEPLLIERPFFSIIGGIQPAILPEAFGNEQLMGNGFLQRWLFVFPPEQPAAMYSERTLPESLKNDYTNYICNLLSFDFSDIGGEFHVTGEAKKIYIDYYNALQKRMADVDDYTAAVYAKLQIIVIRWAGIAHFLHEAENLPQDISAEAMTYAVKCMDYFEESAKKVYELLQSRSVPQVAAPTKEQIMAYLCNSFNIKSKQAVADAIGQERSAVSRAAKKYPMLRVTCYAHENADKQGVSDEKQRNTQNDDDK